MARRRVEVELILAAANYLREAKEVALVTRSASRALDDLGDESDTASRDLRKMAANTDVARREVDDLGEEAAQTAAELALMNHELREAQKLGGLGGMNPHPGGGGGSNTSGIAKAGEEVGDEFVKHVGKGISGKLSGMLSSAGMRPMLYGAIAALAAGLAPLVGGMIGSIFTSVAGLGAMAGGIMAASRSSQVQSAAASFSDRIGQKFTNLGTSFIGPVVKSLDILQDGFDKMDIDNVFEEMAPYVEIVARGISGMGQEFMPEFRRALIAAKPSIELLASMLPQLGQAIGEVFRKIAEARGAKVSMLVFMGAIIAFVRGVGNVISWLENVLHWFLARWAEFSGVLEDIPVIGGLFAGLNDDVERLLNTADTTVIRGLGDDFEYVGDSGLSAYDAIKKLDDELFGFYDRTLAAADAADAYAQGLLDLKDSVKEHGRSLKDNTADGLANRAALRGLVEDALALRQANIDSGMETDEANAKYQQQVRDLQALAVKLGFAKDAVADLIGQYDRIPPRITTQIIAQYQQEGKPAGEHSGLRFDERNGERRASGGRLIPGVPYLYGEHGPEIGMFGQPGQMYSHSQSAAMAGGWQSAAAAGGLLTMQLTVITKDTSGRELRRELRTEAISRGKASDVVAAAYP
jgi:hypothetical protein